MLETTSQGVARARDVQRVHGDVAPLPPRPSERSKTFGGGSVTIHPNQDEMLRRYEPLVRTVCRRFYAPRIIDREDLLQAGRIGLWRGLEAYDPAQGALSAKF